MVRFTVKVPNNDEGEDLGVFEAETLPRKGEAFVLFHPRLCGNGDDPFVGTVDAVIWEASHKDHKYASNANENTAFATVWLIDEAPAPTLYCDCTAKQRELHGIDARGDCGNCGHAIDPRPGR